MPVGVWNPEEKGPLGRYWQRCENNIKMNLAEIRWGFVDCVQVTHVKDLREFLWTGLWKFGVKRGQGDP